MRSSAALLLAASVFSLSCLAQDRRTETYRDGSSYEGEFLDGKRHGRGTYNFADKAKYVGEWRSGDMSGLGRMEFSGGGSFTGEFRADMWVRGVQVSENGNKYEGAFENKRRHGKGAFTWTNGDTYIGHWKDGLANGEGVLTIKGSVYVGTFVNGCINTPDGRKAAFFKKLEEC